MKKIKTIRHNWKYSEVKKLFNLSFNDLLYKSHSIHRKNFKNNKVQLNLNSTKVFIVRKALNLYDPTQFDR